MAYFLKKTNNKNCIWGWPSRLGDLVQYDDMAFNYIIADAKGDGNNDDHG